MVCIFLFSSSWISPSFFFLVNHSGLEEEGSMIIPLDQPDDSPLLGDTPADFRSALRSTDKLQK